MAADLGGSGHSATADAAEPALQVFVTMPIKEDALESFLPTMRANARASRLENGNVFFDVFLNEAGGSNIYLLERWHDQAAFEQHLTEAHLKAVIGALETAGAGEPTLVWLEVLQKIPPATNVRAAIAPRNVFVMFDTFDETREPFLDAIAHVVPNARAAAGNLGFDVFQVKEMPNRFALVEHWASAADHEAHLEAEYSQRFGQALGGLLAANPMESRWLLVELDVDGQ